MGNYGVLLFNQSIQDPSRSYQGQGSEIYFENQTNGTKDWQCIFRLPIIGVGVSYFNLGSPDIYGSLISTTSYLGIPLLTKPKMNLRTNIGVGLVHSNKFHDRLTNPTNRSLSAPINFGLRVDFNYEVKLAQYTYLSFIAGYRHLSNAALNLPNQGLNYPIAGMGIHFIPKNIDLVPQNEAEITFDKDLHFNMMTSISWREALSEDYKHKAYTMSLYASKQFIALNSILLGLDAFYYEKDNITQALKKGTYPAGTKIDGRQLAITAGTELNLGKLWVLVQAGVYIFEPANFYSAWYQRYGFKYFATKNLFLQTTLKAHFGRADMPEFGIGLKL